jgi:hypothetical protein
MGRLKIRDVVNGEPIILQKEVSHYLICCDCQSAHRFILSDYGDLSKDILVLRMWKDKRMTNRERKGRKK